MVEQRKAEARLPIVRKGGVHAESFYSQVIDIPKRPKWTRDMTKEQLEAQEHAMFEKYLDGIYSRFPFRRLNYFEHNLEVWRQLWRVCEVSDALMILADIRHPMFHFPPALYNFVVKDLKKPLILVLTKADLVPTDNVVKWTQYFTDTFPGLHVVSYCSFERKSSEEQEAIVIGTKQKARQRTKGYTPTGVDEIMEIIKSFHIVKNGRHVPVDYMPPNAQPSLVSLHSSGPTPPTDSATTSTLLPTSEQLSENEPDEEDDDEENLDEASKQEELKRIEEAMNEDHYKPVKESDHIILGMIGNPNVGKSTFINAMKGRKVCSTSRTPGHTKWKQTIFLNKNMMLVDCPGLVFPAVDMPKQLQILCGTFPIAQVREPYSSIQYMAKYVPIEKVYRVKIEDVRNPVTKWDPEKGEIEWSAWMICEAYAAKRGFNTAHGGLDVHRAGQNILYDIIDGRLVLYFLPNQTSINLGAYTDPDGKIIHPLLPKSDSEPTLPDLPSDASSPPPQDATQGRRKKITVLAAQSSDAKDEDETDARSSDPDSASHVSVDGSSHSGRDDDPDFAPMGSNPFDVLG